METKELSLLTQNLVKEMEEKNIENDSDYQYMAEWIKRNKKTQKIVKDHFEDDKKRTYAEYKQVLADIKLYLDPLENTEKIGKNKMSKYFNDQEKKRIEEERRLQAIEDKKVEEEKLKEAINKNDEKILDEPIISPTIKVENKIKTEGISYVTTYGFEIVDASKVPDRFKIIDEKMIGQVVRANKGKVSIPGVKVIEKKMPRVR
jgi:hypothetical protein